jgi:hypothetical protein
MIGHAHGNDIGNLVQVGNDIHFPLYGICFNNRHDLTIGEHTMNLHSCNSGNLSGNSFGPALYTRNNNTRNRHVPPVSIHLDNHSKLLFIGKQLRTINTHNTPYKYYSCKIEII